jgi:hypothetical protein
VLFREAVAVYCENHTEQKNPVRASQEAHYITATETTRLMLFRETVAVYCENHTEHTDALCVGRLQSSSMLKQVMHIVTTFP